jgi:hypothetical protein
VSVDLAVDPDDVFTLYQDPGRRPRYLQFESLAAGCRLTWMIERLDAGEVQEFRLVPTPRRRRPSPRVRWKEPENDQVEATLDGAPFCIWRLSADGFPSLRELQRSDAARTPLLDQVWLHADLWPVSHSHTILAGQVSTMPGAVYGRLTYRCHWLGPQQQRLAEERTRWTVYATPERLRLLELEAQIRATTGPVAFAAPSLNGLLHLRLAEPHARPAADVICTAAGAVGREAISGLPSGWCAVPGPTGLAALEHPSNPGSGSIWRLSSDGVLSADPFAAFDRFEPFVSQARLQIAAGEAATFRYRICALLSDPPVGAWRLHYLGYALPPIVEVL